jgi:hypothetical protein
MEARDTQQGTGLRRLYEAMKRYRGLALSLATPAALAVAAILLILVVLPAALGAQAGANR